MLLNWFGIHIYGKFQENAEQKKYCKSAEKSMESYLLYSKNIK
jgi:hypothetical protein